MNKKLFTSVAVAALAFGVGTSSAFAKGNKNFHGNPFVNQAGGREENFGHHNLPFPMGMHQNPCGMIGEDRKADLLGTVSAVDDSKQIVTIKDADGKETQVHVNPLTRIHEMEKPETKPDSEDKNRPNERKWPEINELKLEDLKAGAWVMVKKFDTETKTLEAARIMVAKAK